MPEPKLLYHFMKTEYALQGIQHHRLKFSNLDDVNDPYESFPIRFNDCEEENVFFNSHKDLIKKTGSVSFSETYQDPTLWGHYADNCKGICLGFDVKWDYGPNNFYAKRVQYVKHKIEINEIGMKFNNGKLEPLQKVIGIDLSKLLINMLLTKSSHWSHEEEWRLLKLKDKNYQFFPTFYYFDRDNVATLREILIGFRCPQKEDIKCEIEELIASDEYYSTEPAKIFFTKRSLSDFKIEKEVVTKAT